MAGLLIILFAFFLSAFFSGSETACISARKFRFQIWAKQGRHGAKKTLEYLQHPDHFISTTLVGNNIAVVAASSLMAVELQGYFNGFQITVISSLFLLFFGEILPKSIARETADTWILTVRSLLRIFYVLFYPLIFGVRNLSRFLLRFGRDSQEDIKSFFSRQDMDILVRESEKSGLVPAEESDLISRFILRGKQSVKDIMIPRTEMTVLDREQTVDQAVELLTRTGRSRIPVTGKDDDHLIGILHAHDVLLLKPERITDILRKILYIPDTVNVAQAFKTMQKKQKSIAIIVDEYGGTMGLVTMEDIVEEFFGEIQDEHDADLTLYRKISPFQIDVNAMIEIDELNERFTLDLPAGDYKTLGGLLLDHLGYIPKRGEKIALEKCNVLVISANNQKVSWVRITRQKDADTGKN